MDDELGALALKQLEPKRLSLPKWLLKHERVTWVLDGFVPPRDPSSERCPRCEKPLTRIVSLDLSAYAGAGLPRKTILILRCRNSSTCSIGDASRGPVAIVRVKVSGGDCPKGHRE